MIRVVLGGLEEIGTEGVLRPVTQEFDGTSTISRRLDELAGEDLGARLLKIGELPAGAAILTPAGDLPFPFLIHAVVKTPDEPTTEAILRRAVTNGLRRAEEWALESLTLIPFGIGPGSLGADAAVRTTLGVLHEHMRTADTLREIVVLAGSEYVAEAFRRGIEGA